MQLTFSTKFPDLPKHKCLALGIFADEKPPRGIGGFIDWRLNGLISREIKQGRISGEFMEKTIIPFPQRIGTEFLLLFGLGNLAAINYDRIYNAAYLIAGAVDGMSLHSFAFDLHGEGRCDLATSGIVEAMLTGFYDFLSADKKKISNMAACIVTSPSHLQEVSIGIKHFNANCKDRGSVDVCALENSLA
jgi:hypothetical protein